MIADIVAQYPNDEFLQYRWRENPRSLELSYWENHFELQYFKSWAHTGLRVFDFGCGTGGMTELLRRDGYAIFGYDESKGSIAIARYIAPKCEFYDILPDRKDYDRVWMCHVIEHVPEKEFGDLFKTFLPNVPILISTPLGFGYDDGSGHHVNHWFNEQDLMEALSPVVRVDWVTTSEFRSVLRAQVCRRL